MRTLTVLLILCSAAIPVFSAAPDKVLPAINEIDRRQRVGQQPYEMTWVQRSEDPRTLIDFEDMRGWTLELFDGAAGELRRSKEEQMWGQYTAKIVYSGGRKGSRVVARPPKPVPIPGKFDAIDMWGYGDRLRYSSAQGGAGVMIAILVADARGKEFRFEITDVRWVGWWLVHRRAAADLLKQVVWPAGVSGIEVSMGEDKGERYFFCDSLVLYAEELKPLTFKPQPKRNLKPFRGQIAGVNTGEGTLPFPTREETILPANFEKDFKVAARELEKNVFEFRYAGRDATVVYTYCPRTGSLGELTASVDGGPPFRPADNGGLRFTDTPEGQIARGELLSASLKGDTVGVKFRSGSRVFDYQLRLWQKSMVLDVWCDGGEATTLAFGRVAGVRNPKLITVPYITYSSFNPRILMSGDPSKPVFTTVWFDWYRSNASAPHFVKEPTVTADSAEINGELRYIAKTNGQRNNLYERLFITTSPVYEETFPTIPNPPSLRQEEGKQVVWTTTSPETFQGDHLRCRKIRSYGLDKIMQHSHEVTWRDHSDSYTMRLHAAPQKGGDAMLQWYIKAQNGLGWLQGIYSNYCDFAPVNTNWDPDFVQRLPDGEWRRAWYRTYALKPAKSVEMDEYYAPRLKERYGIKMSYTDVHTDNPPPWEYCDFDARVPGAGTFAATFYAYGQLLINDQKIYGPTQSESTFQWLFAGLQSGGYGWVYTDVNLLTHPVDSAFMLHKIHPLECDYGMGYTHYYLDRIEKEWKTSPKKRDYVDLFLATTIGYGNMGWLVNDFGLDDPFGVEAMTRSYYMMQQLQQQYAFVRPKTIEYAGRNGKMYTPSQAHANGAIAESRIHIEYENGTHVYVNRGAEGVWTVKSVEIPVNGWLAYNNGFYEISANVSGRRIDYVKASEYEFLDGRGEWTERGRLGSTGSVARRDRAPGVIELIDIYGNGRIAFEAPAGGEMLAYDWEGKPLGKVDVKSPRTGWQEFKPVPNGRMYVYAEK